MISMDRKYKTRDGRNVRILATDIKDSQYPVAAAIQIESREFVDSFTADGHRVYNEEREDDLFEVKPRIQRTVWLNIYEEEKYTMAHISKDLADASAEEDRIACVKVTIDVEEGMG